MRSDGKSGGKGLFSRRSLAGYVKIVSSGASSVASTVRSAGASIAASIADDGPVGDRVHWAGFDKLECEDGSIRQVLLLAYVSGFEIWDVEEANNVHQVASRQDGHVSFMQVLKRPATSKKCKDWFADLRPLLAVAGDDHVTAQVFNHDNVGSFQEQGSGTNVKFYSLRMDSYVHLFKLRGRVLSIRCGPQVVAVCQASQIHCFDAATLERNYTFLTYPLASGSPGLGGIGYGPLAVGTRWLAYSGNWVIIDCSGRINPQHPDSINSSSSSAGGSLVAHYARGTGKQLVSGLATLGDLGYKALSRYCSELLPDGNHFTQEGLKRNANRANNDHLSDRENAGMVIVRDVVSRSVVVQFRAHSSPICALCFDPSGTLLVTASTCGHNIKVFHVTPWEFSSASRSFTHLYTLQRGFTNAVIQDISFSFDSRYISISSSKGTNHLFALSSHGGIPVVHPYDATNITSNGLSSRSMASNQFLCGSSSLKVKSTLPITLSAITRIKNGGSGWKGTVTDAAAAAAGRVSLPCGAISSAFHACGNADVCHSLGKYYLLVFSPAGSLMKYVLQRTFDDDSLGYLERGSFSTQDTQENLDAKALQKWDICNKHNRVIGGRSSGMHVDDIIKDNSRCIRNGNRKGITVFTRVGNKKNHIENNAEEGRHAYISAVELLMHPAGIPLWAKPEINFQVMVAASASTDNGNINCEIEIEKLSTRTIIVRSKDLIPATDYPQLPKFQHSRLNGSENRVNGALLPRESSLSDVRNLSLGRSSTINSFSYASSPNISNDDFANEWDSYSDELQKTVGSLNGKGSLNAIPIERLDKITVPTLKSHLAHANNLDSPMIGNLFVGGDNDLD